MPYIAGQHNNDGKIIIVKESDWSVEVNEDVTYNGDGSYYEEEVTAGKKLVIFRNSEGEVEAHGNVDPSDEQHPTWEGGLWVPPVSQPSVDHVVMGPTYWNLNRGSWDGTKYVEDGTTGDLWLSCTTITPAWWQGFEPVELVIQGTLDSGTGSSSNVQLWGDSIFGQAAATSDTLTISINQSMFGWDVIGALHLNGYETVTFIGFNGGTLGPEPV
jgi:hypothetical protein